MVILHLMPAEAWTAWAGRGPYAAESLAVEGFVHASPDDDVLLEVANRFYAGSEGDWVVVTLDVDGLTSEVRWEPADGRLFPHVYGPLDGAAVAGVRAMVRSRDGRFVGYASA